MAPRRGPRVAKASKKMGEKCLGRPARDRSYLYGANGQMVEFAMGTGQSTRHWVYTNDARTHEVHAQSAIPGNRAGILRTTEFPVGSNDPTEVVLAEMRVEDELQLRMLLRELEERLAFTGTYYRADAANMKWANLPQPERTAPDLRAHQVPLPGAGKGAAMQLHHFHKQDAGQDRMLLSMPSPGAPGRHVLAQVEFDWPDMAGGDLNILHHKLTATTLKSSVVREHIEAPRKGFAKLIEARDYQRTFGDSWRERTKQMLSRAANVFFGTDAPSTPPEPLPAGAPEDLQLMRESLSSPRVMALKARFVSSIDEAHLVAGGEHAIRRHILGLRMRNDHRSHYDLAIVEAALLLQYADPAQMWDLVTEAGGKVMRFVHGYQ